MAEGGEKTFTRRQILAGVGAVAGSAVLTAIVGPTNTYKTEQEIKPKIKTFPTEPVIPVETKPTYDSSNDVSTLHPPTLKVPIMNTVPVEPPVVKTEPTEQLLPYKAPSVDLKGLENKGSRFRYEITKAAGKYMAIGVPKLGKRNDRTNLEEDLFDMLQQNNASASDIIFALKSAGTVEGRDWGMQLLWKKRQSGQLREFGMEPLDQARIDWATSNNIRPDVLAMSRDCFGAVYELLNVGKDLFYEGMPAEKRNNLRVETTIPNPGAMSMLIMTETSGMRCIGTANAWDEINLANDLFPLGHKHMEIIAKELQDKTGLPYFDNAKKMPGAERGNRLLNSSGGAIGPQLMPMNALVLMEKYKIANERLGNKYPIDPNIFDPMVSTILCTLFLASQLYARHPDVDDIAKNFIRLGYSTLESDEVRLKAFRKWNNSDQPKKVMEVAEKYQLIFGRW